MNFTRTRSLMVGSKVMIFGQDASSLSPDGEWKTIVFDVDDEKWKEVENPTSVVNDAYTAALSAESMRPLCNL